LREQRGGESGEGEKKRKGEEDGGDHILDESISLSFSKFGYSCRRAFLTFPS
jgi:hypothetical protein